MDDDFKEEYFCRILNSDCCVRKRVACDFRAPAELLCHLSNDEDQYVRAAVAGNPNAPARILDKLSRDASYHVYVAVVGNPSTPKMVVDNLIYGNSACNKYNIARYTTNERVLDILSHDSARSVLMGVAENPNAPEYVLHNLSLSHHANVRQSVVSNCNTPIETLQLLSNDADEDVLMGVMNNINVTKDILYDLSFSEFSFIAEEAKHRLFILRINERIYQNNESR